MAEGIKTIKRERKIEDEIEQLTTTQVEVQRPHSVVYRDVVELGLVLRIIDKYKVESEGINYND